MRNANRAKQLSLCLLITATAVLGTWLTSASVARAEKEEHEGRKHSLKVLAERVAQAKLSLDQAILDAEKTTGGKAVEAEYELEGKGLEITVEVLVGEKIKEVEYDAMTGKVSADDDDEHEHEGDDDDDDDKDNN
ncbi:MAG: PepSY domain-containing protein [Phycisphaerales bacterium]